MVAPRVLACGLFAFASGSLDDESFADIVDLEGLSLLQLSAKKSHGTTYKSATLRLNNTDGIETVTCTASGDAHVASNFNGQVQPQANPQGPGLYPLLTKSDGSEAVQFYQCACAVHASTQACGFMNSMAFKFGDVYVRIHPDMDSGTGLPALMCINDEPLWSPSVFDSSPKTRDGYCKTIESRLGVIPGTEGPDEVTVTGHNTKWQLNRRSTGFSAELQFFTHRGYIGPDGGGRNSVEMSGMITMTDPLTTGLDVCFHDPAKWGDIANYMDKRLNDITYADFGSWSAEDDPATPFVESSLFTPDDHDMFCNKCNWVDGKTCDTPPAPPAPAPPSDAACAENECSYSLAQQLCNSLKSHHEDYEACLFDYCVTCDETVVEADIEWEELVHEEPVCADGMEVCAPADVCTKSSTMNTLSIVQNNLGGAGPDQGAEEIRYSKAANINGQSVDLVITADGQYSPKNVEATGVAGSMGSINVKCGTAVTLIFSVVNSDTGAAVSIDDVALSWYDLDEGKKGRGRASVTGCGDGLLTDSNTELAVAQLGSCWSATSSTQGNEADNPSDQFSLTRQQRARVATFPYSGVSSFTSTLNVERGYGARNFLFAVEPAVACTGGD